MERETSEGNIRYLISVMLRLTLPRREVRQVSQVVTITLRFGVCSWALLLEMQSSPCFYFLLQNHSSNTCQGNNMISLLEECGLSSVLSRPNRNLKWQTSITALGHTLSQLSDRPVLQLRVTAQFYLENKGKYILEAWGHADPKDTKRRGEMPLPFGSSFYVDFFSSLRACSMYTGLARSAVCSTWGPHCGPQNFLCSIFSDFSLPWLLATAILDSFFYSNKS